MTTCHVKRVLLGGAMAFALAACQMQDDVEAVYRSDTSSGDPTAPADRHARAIADFNAARFADALRGFRAELERDPGSLRALNGVAASYDRQGQYELALRYYERALARDPDHAVTLNNLGYSYLLQGRADLAYVYLADALERLPDRAVIQNNYTAAASRLDDTDKVSSYARAPLDPVYSEPIPAAGSYGFERVSHKVQRLVPLAPEPQPQFASAAGTADGRPGQPLPAGGARLATSKRPAMHGVTLPGPLTSIEIANGTGRQGMAARLRGYLERRGILGAVLTNAETFGVRRSVVFYRPGWDAEAASLAAMLPGAVELGRAPSAQLADLRLVLGADLMAFDNKLQSQGGGAARRNLATVPDSRDDGT